MLDSRSCRSFMSCSGLETSLFERRCAFTLSALLNEQAAWTSSGVSDVHMQSRSSTNFRKKTLFSLCRRLCSENTVHLSEFGCCKQLLETVMMRTLRLNHTANGPQNDEIKQDEQQTTPRKDCRVALYYEPFSLCTCNDRAGNLRSYYKVISSSTSSGAEHDLSELFQVDLHVSLKCSVSGSPRVVFNSVLIPRIQANQLIKMQI